MKLLLAVCVAIYFNGVCCGTTPKPEQKRNFKDFSAVQKDIVIDPNDEYELQLVQVIFRHGDRTPDKIEIYETDPYDDIYRSHGYGQLTKIGKQREHRIGQILKTRYGDFVGDYKSRDVFAYSTNADRTKMSLLLVLAGLYPPSNKTSWSDEIQWAPIPTHYDALGTDFLLGFACPRYIELLEEVGKSAEIQEKLKKYDNFYKYLQNSTGATTDTPTSVLIIYNNIHAAQNLGLDLPKWCNESIYNTILEISAIAIQTLTHNEEMKSTMGGLVIEKLLDNISDNPFNERKLCLYSAHDLNVASFTNVHNFTNVPPVPDFGSTIIFEQLKKKDDKDDQSYIRTYLWTGATEKWIPLKLENCELTCPLSTYKKLTEHLLPNEFAKKCTSVNNLCMRSPNLRKIDVVFELTSLYGGKDLNSFKYMKNYRSPYECNIRNVSSERE